MTKDELVQVNLKAAKLLRYKNVHTVICDDNSECAVAVRPDEKVYRGFDIFNKKLSDITPTVIMLGERFGLSIVANMIQEWFIRSAETGHINDNLYGKYIDAVAAAVMEVE